MSRTETSTCDGCGCEGVVCETPAGEVAGPEGTLVTPAEIADGSLEILCAGRVDGSELHYTYCDACARVRT